MSMLNSAIAGIENTIAGVTQSGYPNYAMSGFGYPQQGFGYPVGYGQASPYGAFFDFPSYNSYSGSFSGSNMGLWLVLGGVVLVLILAKSR